ncbi:Cullin-4B [Mycena floridula]|nr:Cullin-4B [Mycena floridula]
MALDLYSLLSLPTTSKGFTKSRPSTRVQESDGSASPARKIARLVGDSDSASASRSSKHTGPIIIQTEGAKPEQLLENNGPTFASMRNSIREILTRPNHGLTSSYEKIYNECRYIVTLAKDGETLYGRVKEELEKVTSKAAADLIAGADHENWISLFVSICRWFEGQVSLLKSLLTYLNQVYVPSASGVLEISDLAYGIFAQKVFSAPQISSSIQAELSKWLNTERNKSCDSMDIDDHHNLVKSLVQHLITHSQYTPFEEFYLKETRAFYVAESAHLAEGIMKTKATDFFDHVEKRIEEEMTRARSLLPSASWSLVREATEEALMTDRMQWLASNTLEPYIKDEKMETLGKMYELFKRVAGTKTLCLAFRAHVQESVEGIIKKTPDDEIVVKLLAFKASVDCATAKAFVDTPSSDAASTSKLPETVPNKEFAYASDDGFTTAFKVVETTKPAEMMARHLDKIMRKGQGSSTDAAFEQKLDEVLSLYRYSDDKDVFRTFYHRQLAKRLLLQKSASNDFEQGMLQKLVKHYDADFGLAMDMFKDLELSRNLMDEYRVKLPQGSNVSVMVLQQRTWPFTKPESQIDLPLKMQDELNIFKALYKTKHGSRVLNWDHALATVTMTARFRTETKELSLSLYQAIVLLLFNEEDTLGLSDIAERTRLADDDLRRTLQSLACGKKKILTKQPKGGSVGDLDLFTWNGAFTDPRAKIHINSIQAKPTPQETAHTQHTIEGDRKYHLEAAIVRIMKARKSMPLEHLIAATIDAVKNHFLPNVVQIRDRILSLIAQEYIEERGEEDVEDHHLDLATGLSNFER